MFYKETRFQRKLMAVILLTTSMALFVSCAGFISYEIFTIRKNMARALDTRAEIVAANLASTLALQNQAEATEILQGFKNDARTISACIYDANGNIFARYPTNAPNTVFPASPGQPGHFFGPASLSTFFSVGKNGRTLGTVYLESNLSALTDRYNGYAWLTLIVFVSSLLVAYLLSKILQKQISRPVQALAETAKAISEHGDYSVRATKYSDDELGLLTDTFNHMLVRIQEQNGVLLQFAAIIKSSDDAIFSKTLEGIITSWNPGAEKLFGYSAPEAIGQSMLLLIPPDRVAEETFILARLARGETIDHFETVRVKKDGTLVDISASISPIKDASGKVISISKIARSITERKKAEQALRQGREEFKDLFDNAPLGYHEVNAEGRLARINKTELKMLGYSAEELLGQFVWKISGEEEVSKRAVLAKLGGEPPPPAFERILRRKDGSTFPALIEDRTVRNEAGQIVGIRAVIQDITERKLAEEKIRQFSLELEQRVIERTAELESANKELEAFSYSVSHDLRAPLRAVDGFSQAVEEDYGAQLPDEGRRYLRTIREGAQRMGTLIDDLLTFSRLSRQPLNQREVNVNTLVLEALEGLNPRQNGRQVEIQVGELPTCQGDPALLKQVWINVLSNALKYSSQRAVAVIEIGCDTASGENIYFVRDNGTGFDMQYANKLFGVFQRLHRAEEFEGTGVGLAIVQRVIHRHGGRIWAKSEPDQGATFYFTLSP